MLVNNQKLAIENPKTGHITYTTLFQLIQWKGAVKLVMHGMKHSSRKSICAHVKRQFKWKGNRQKIYDNLCQTLDLIEEQMKEMEQ